MKKVVLPIFLASLFPQFAFACIADESSLQFILGVLIVSFLFFTFVFGIYRAKYMQEKGFLYLLGFYLLSILFGSYILAQPLSVNTMCMTPRDNVLKLVFYAVPFVCLFAFHGLVLLSSLKKITDEGEKKKCITKMSCLVFGMLLIGIFMFVFVLNTPDQESWITGLNLAPPN